MNALSTTPISLGLVSMRFLNGTAFFGNSRKMITSVGIPKFAKISVHGFPLHIILLVEFSYVLVEWFAFQKVNNPSEFQRLSSHVSVPFASDSKVLKVLVEWKSP